MHPRAPTHKGVVGGLFSISIILPCRRNATRVLEGLVRPIVFRKTVIGLWIRHGTALLQKMTRMRVLVCRMVGDTSIQVPSMSYGGDREQEAPLRQATGYKDNVIVVTLIVCDGLAGMGRVAFIMTRGCTWTTIWLHCGKWVAHIGLQGALEMPKLRKLGPFFMGKRSAS